MSGLTDKQKIFIEAYLECWNATEAARRAGYEGNDNTLGSVGWENLQKPYIRQEVDRRLAELRVNDRGLVSDKRTQRRACFVYLICAENGLVKIGKTVDIASRLRTLNAMSPVDLKLVGCVESEFADELENRLHAEFDAVRVKGEWFALSPDDVESIKRHYGFDE